MEAGYEPANDTGKKKRRGRDELRQRGCFQSGPGVHLRAASLWPGRLLGGDQRRRDFGFNNPLLIETAPNQFEPDRTVTQLDLAVALVRAQGRETQAAEMAGMTVIVNGQALIDNGQIPEQLRGHVQLAINLGFLEAFPAEVIQIGPGQFMAVPGPRFEPATVKTRAALAASLTRFAQVFAAGF